ncbi:hypothetical protein PAXRUDRAFT_148507 [Paxillus rubicundulus Ve08.2h10]|uniref:Alpha-type protein kinase domain-containing protein n=1 Tax=Paxillus rubicundulus Ve08.2h10 TaxID=930991 RepID=A0A0D0E400_9AGAM|nr:hypothetical protein PAXRUDRAFT_148507 [Paxillus rubicundulus Ve08.2h10]
MCFQITEELEKVFREANVLYWVKLLLAMMYNFIERALDKAKESPPFNIPQLCFVDAGLVLAYSQRPNAPSGPRAPKAGMVTTAYLAEEAIDHPEDEFIKFIHNSDLTPLPDPGEPGYEITEFLAFMQHVQYHKTGGQVYISDYQGSICQPSIIAHKLTPNDRQCVTFD